MKHVKAGRCRRDGIHVRSGEMRRWQQRVRVQLNDDGRGWSGVRQSEELVIVRPVAPLGHYTRIDEVYACLTHADKGTGTFLLEPQRLYAQLDRPN